MFLFHKSSCQFTIHIGGGGVFSKVHVAFLDQILHLQSFLGGSIDSSKNCEPQKHRTKNVITLHFLEKRLKKYNKKGGHRESS